MEDPLQAITYLQHDLADTVDHSDNQETAEVCGSLMLNAFIKILS